MIQTKTPPRCSAEYSIKMLDRIMSQKDQITYDGTKRFVYFGRQWAIHGTCLVLLRTHSEAIHFYPWDQPKESIERWYGILTELSAFIDKISAFSYLDKHVDGLL